MDVLMIVKNEQDGILVTLDSLSKIGFKGTVYVYDTGSTDKTEEVAQGHVIATKFGHGEFIDFSSARNAAQDWAITQGCSEWIIWLDSNDELVGTLPEQTLLDSCQVLNLEQVWHLDGKYETKFFNKRAYKLPNIRWHGRVHEWIHTPETYVAKNCPNLQIYQNRRKNCSASETRWHKDIEFLLLDIADNPNCTRTMFYLARAYKDCKQNTQAIKWFKRRLSCTNFPEERFWSAIYIGEMTNDIDYYLQAYNICPRVEALLPIADFYIALHQYNIAFLYLYRALAIPLPSQGLFVKREDYIYRRYHLMGIVAYYVGEINIGKSAVESAISARNYQIDIDNLKWYK